MIGRVYQLVCPVINKPIYVGSTIHTLKARLSCHNSAKDNRPLYNYLRKNNIKPRIELLEEIEVENVKELRLKESQWIESVKLSFPIFNVAAIHYKEKQVIKLRAEIVKLVRKYCSRNKILIGEFIERAAIKELEREYVKSKR